MVGRYTEQAELDIDSQKLPRIEGVNFALFDALQEPDLITIWCAPIIWATGRFDSIIKSVADYQDANFLFVSLETGEAYAPYDGGADLFLASTARRDEMKNRYSQWLSKHPQEL